MNFRMNILFMEKPEKNNILKRVFKPIECINKKIFLNYELNKTSTKKKIKLVAKVKNILKIHKSNTIIISKNIKDDKEFMDILYSNNINIIDGRNLFKRLAIDTVQCIVKQKKFDINDSRIAILTNEYDGIIENIIKSLSMQCKNLQIITNHIKKFERIESELYEDGIIINVMNNKRKSLLKTNIILNIDFPNETINKFNIYENATIVNFEEKTKINKKRFSGKIINWYKAGIENKEQIFGFLEEKNIYKYDFNELIECLYLLDIINAEDIYLESLVTR